MLDRLRDQLAFYLTNADAEDVELVEKELEILEEILTKPKPNSSVTSKHDPRNTLNDMTGAEWVFFLNSVESTAYSTKGPEGFAHKIRRIHPSPKPPQLMSKVIQFFTKKDGWVLDPFVGVGGTLLGCSLSGRNGIGIDLNQPYLDAYKQVCEEVRLNTQHTICGDSRYIPDLIAQIPEIPEQFDLILTDPPYSDMLARARTGQQKKDTGSAEATPFTDLAHDLGNLPREEFLEQLRQIMQLSIDRLKPKGYCIIFCKDLQPTPEYHNMLHMDVVNEMLKIEGLRFRGYKIWHDKTPKLYPFGYPFAFVSNQLHQFILIFRKEQVVAVPKPRSRKRNTEKV